MLAGIGLRHQHLDIATGELRCGVPENLFGRFIERQDQTMSIDSDNTVECRIEHGTKQRVTAR
jgi:hypothetical protein